MTSAEITLYWTLCATEDALRVVLFWRRRTSSVVVFRWWLLLTGLAQTCLDIAGWFHRPGSLLYDYAWRTESLLALAGLVLVACEAVGWRSTPPVGCTTECRRWAGERMVPALATLAVLYLLSHPTRWPQFWLEPVFRCILVVNLWCGLAIVQGGRKSQHRAILAAWCLLTAALYSGAALSIDRAGLAVELLNVAALAALLVLGESWCLTVMCLKRVRLVSCSPQGE